MTYKILIVDDSRLARMAVARTLDALRPGWVRVEATNAEEALAAARRAPVHLALLDLNMPGRDGLALAEELQKLNPAMPLAIVSANHQDGIIRQAHQVGAAFLPKPLTAEALGDFLTGAVRRLQTAE